MPSEGRLRETAAKAAEAKGWKLLRVRGSHHCYVKPGETELLVIPIHGNSDLKVGLLRKLMKQAGISQEDL